METTHELQAISEWLPLLIDALASGSSEEQFISNNQDVQYLGRRSNLAPPFIRRMVGWFGEPVVVEALRRFDRTGAGAAYFVGICRGVEREA